MILAEHWFNNEMFTSIVCWIVDYTGTVLPLEKLFNAGNLAVKGRDLKKVDIIDIVQLSSLCGWECVW